MRSSLERALRAVALLSAVIAAVVVTRRQVATERAMRLMVERAPVMRDWRSFGTSDAMRPRGRRAVQIVVFADYHCLHCRALVRTLDAVGRSFPGRLAVTWRHIPRMSLESGHAALAVECAGRHDARDAVHRAIVARFDSGRGSVDWALAAAAGVKDSSAFVACLADPLSEAAVRRDMVDAERLGISGVPLVLLDSLRFNGAPSEAFVRYYIKRYGG